MTPSRLLRLLLWGALVLCALLLALTLFSPGSQLPVQTGSVPLSIVGEYAVDGSPVRFPLSVDTQLEDAALTSLTLFGHLNHEVLPGSQVVLRIADLRVTILVNGQTVFSFGDVHPSMVRSSGDVWTAFTSSGITTADDIEIRLARVYAYTGDAPFTAFLEEFAAGSEYRAYLSTFRAGAPTFVLGSFILLLGVALLCVSLYTRGLKLLHTTEYLYLSAFVLCSGLWVLIDYRYITLLIPYPAFCSTLELLCMAFAPVFLMRYILFLLKPRERRIGWVVLFVTLSAALAGVCLQISGTLDYLTLTSAYGLLDTATVGVLTFCLLRSLRPPCDADSRAAIFPLFILFGGALLNIANHFFSWRTNSLFYAVAFLVFSAMELLRLIHTLRDHIRRNSEYARLENELTQSRIAVMLSQIKPHFLFNALNSISALCLTDPPMADQAITSLSNYLRGNIRSLEQSTPVPFEQELNHIKYYVRLEQLRYGDKLRVVYAIDHTAFEVPTLSLQTLVENAIRHGVSPKPEGGLVVVQTQKGEHCSIVRIIDNGVGFDPDMQSRNADSIGLANARKRMEAMMNAHFDVQSIPGQGTTITIRIPDPERKAIP